MAYANGALPSSALGKITKAVNGQQAYLEKHAAKAFMAMNAESEARYGVTLRVSSARVAYRPLADQWYFWNLYKSGRGALAAFPGTSNHGWGVAVDLATPQMRTIIDKIGAKYGWQKQWSDAPSEWWHIKYRPGVWNGRSPYDVPRTLKPGQKAWRVLRLRRALKRHHADKHGAWRKHPLSRKYGDDLVAAVKHFQKNHGLQADGIVGPATWRKLL